MYVCWQLEELLLEEEKMITRCAFCGQLFALKNRRKLVCAKAKIYIDYHGNVISEHVPLAKWGMNKVYSRLSEFLSCILHCPIL